MSSASSAVPLDAIKFSVPYVTRYDLQYPNTYGQQYPRGDRPDAATHKANLADIISRIEESISQSNSAKSLYRVESALSSARALASQAKQYAVLFGLKLPKLPAIPVLKQDRREKLTAFDAERQSRTDARTAARAAQWEEQRRLDALSLEERIAAWRAGSSARFWNMTRDGFAILRVTGSNVETSMGVSVPINGLAGAGRLLRFLTACKNAGRPYQRNGHTEHIGNFTVESFQPLLDDQADVSPTGEWILIAGCHRIKWSEVESIREAVETVHKAFVEEFNQTDKTRG